jgi:hypothetical protein
MKYGGELTSCGMIHIVSFITIGAFVQAVVRFGQSYLRGSNVDITDSREL